jgi:hypothetical protein
LTISLKSVASVMEWCSQNIPESCCGEAVKNVVEKRFG